MRAKYIEKVIDKGWDWEIGVSRLEDVSIMLRSRIRKADLLTIKAELRFVASKQLSCLATEIDWNWLFEIKIVYRLVAGGPLRIRKGK